MPAMRAFGLIGYPLDHSFSAEWFARMFLHNGISDATYRNYPLPSIDALPALLAEPALLGFNVTAPYKQAVMAYLDELDPTALRIGAVNCVVRQGDRWKGYNVDWIGFAESVTELTAGQRPRALLLGSGGAAAAAAFGLARLGIDYTTVSRTKQGTGFLSYGELTRSAMQRHRLIVNATPLGTYPDTAHCPPIPYHLLTSDHLLYDMVYNPPETLFLHRGLEARARTMNGLRMLEIQAEKSWELFRTARPAAPLRD